MRGAQSHLLFVGNGCAEPTARAQQDPTAQFSFRLSMTSSTAPSVRGLGQLGQKKLAELCWTISPPALPDDDLMLHMRGHCMRIDAAAAAEAVHMTHSAHLHHLRPALLPCTRSVYPQTTWPSCRGCVSACQGLSTRVMCCALWASGPRQRRSHRPCRTRVSRRQQYMVTWTR